jgi:hypothetical protein
LKLKACDSYFHIDEAFSSVFLDVRLRFIGKVRISIERKQLVDEMPVHWKLGENSQLVACYTVDLPLPPQIENVEISFKRTFNMLTIRMCRQVIRCVE